MTHAAVPQSLPGQSRDPKAAGASFALLELGLLDELCIFRNPVIVGGGTSFLPPVAEDVQLDLLETRTLESRVIYERYRCTHDARS